MKEQHGAGPAPRAMQEACQPYGCTVKIFFLISFQGVTFPGRWYRCTVPIRAGDKNCQILTRRVLT